LQTTALVSTHFPSSSVTGRAWARSASRQNVSTRLLTSTIQILAARESADEMNYPEMLLLSRWQKASLPFALLYACLSMTLTVSAEDCGKPFSMPVTNVALTDGTRMRGVQVGVGSSDQLLAMVPSLYVDSNFAHHLADQRQAFEQHAHL
jgi:hypothetical protein